MRIKALCFIILLLPLLTGCFDLVEEITIHNNGSGTFVFEANLSQSKTKIKTMMALDSMDGIKIPSIKELNKEMDKAKGILLASDGISNFTESRNFDDFIFSSHFDFRDVTCLNKALSTLFKAFNPGVSPPENSYQFDNHTFTRKNDYNGRQEIKKIQKKEIALLGSANMTCIYRFDTDIKEFSNKDAKLSKSGKALFLKLPIPDLVNGTKNISNTIKL